jgi:outer membrane protein assembly factor BamB
VAGTVAILVDDDHGSLSLMGFGAVSGKRVWAVRAEAGYWADGYPLVSRGSTIYFEDREGNLYAVDAKTGKLKWLKRATRGQNRGAFPVVTGRFIIWNDGDLSVLDAGTGAVRWTANCAPRYAALYGATPGTVLLTTTLGIEDPPDFREETTLCGLDLQSGDLRWHVPVRGAFDFENGACMVSDRVMLVCQGRRLVGMDTETGQEVWTDQADLWPSHTSVQTDGTTVCLTTVPPPQAAAGEPERGPVGDVEFGIGEDEDVAVALRALDLRSGKLLWERPGRSPFYPVAVHDGSVYLYDEGRRLLVLDARSGEARWQTHYAPGPAAHGSILFAQDTLLLTVGSDIRAMYLRGVRQVPRGDHTGPSSNVGQ